MDESKILKTWIITKAALERNVDGFNKNNFINKKAVKSFRRALRRSAFAAISLVSVSQVPSSVIDVD